MCRRSPNLARARERQLTVRSKNRIQRHDQFRPDFTSHIQRSNATPTVPHNNYWTIATHLNFLRHFRYLFGYNGCARVKMPFSMNATETPRVARLPRGSQRVCACCLPVTRKTGSTDHH